MISTKPLTATAWDRQRANGLGTNVRYRRGLARWRMPDPASINTRPESERCLRKLIGRSLHARRCCPLVRPAGTSAHHAAPPKMRVEQEAAIVGPSLRPHVHRSCVNDI